MSDIGLYLLWASLAYFVVSCLGAFIKGMLNEANK